MTLTGPPGPPSADAPLADLHALCAATAAAFREGHQMAVASREHNETILVWLAGLMGAGIFSAERLVASAPLCMRLSVFVPWTLGILSAVAGRLVGVEFRTKDDRQHFNRISTLGLLQLETDAAKVVKDLSPIIQAGVHPTDAESKTINRWRMAFDALIYLAHVAFAIGVVAAVATMIVAGR